MALFDEILAHPDFGRTFRGSRHFRALLESAMPSIQPDIPMIHNRLKIDIDDSGEIVLNSKDLNYTFRRGVGENFQDFYQRVTTGNPGRTSPRGIMDPMAPTNDLPLSMVKSAEVIRGNRLSTNVPSEMFSSSIGSYRRNLEEVAKRTNTTIRYRTFEGGTDSLARLYAVLGERGGDTLGFVIPEDDGVKLLEMFNARGEAMTYQEILGAFQIDPADKGAAFKRMNALLNSYETSETMAGGRLKVGMFDPAQLFGQDPITNERVRQLVASGAFPDDSELYRRMADGQSIMSDTAFKKRLNFLQGEVKQMRANLERLTRDGRVGTAQYNKLQKDLAEMEERIQRSASSTISGNVRAVGAVDILNPDADPLFFKGDAIVVSDQEFTNVVRRSARHAGLTDEQIMEMDLFVSEHDAKVELGLRAGRPASISLDITGRPKIAYTNSLTLAAFGDFVNPDDYWQRSLRSSIDDALESIRSGQITPGLARIFDELDNISPDDFETTSEYMGALERQKYAQKIKDFVESGNKLGSNDVMVRDLTRIIREHHFVQRRPGQMVQMGDDLVPDLKLRVPMLGSTRAHMLNKDLVASKLSEFVMENPGMSIQLDHQRRARFGLGALDSVMLSPGWGGSDWDDSLYVSYRYDTKAKRLLALTMRDPNTIGEYALLDADITLDPNFARKMVEHQGQTVSLQSLARRRKKLLVDVEKHLSKNSELDNLSESARRTFESQFAELESINTSLDDYFRSAKEIQGIDVQRMFSQDADTLRYRAMFAPNGFNVDAARLEAFGRGSITRGYGSIGPDISAAAARTQAELIAARQNDFQLPFRYVGDTYRNFLESPTGSRAYRAMETSAALNNVLEGAKLTSESIMSRAQAIAQSQGALGRGVNISEVINQFVRSHTTLSGGYSREQIDKVMSILESNRFIAIEREQLIDAVVKTGDAQVLAAAVGAVDENITTFGRVIGLLHQAGLEDAGIDPMLLGSRFANEADRRMFTRGYNSALGEGQTLSMDEVLAKATLRVTDPKADITKFTTQSIEEMSRLEEEANNLSKVANQTFIDDLKAGGFEATDIERDRAERFLRDFYADRRALTLRDPTDIQALLMDTLNNPSLGEMLDGGVGIDDLLGEYSESELNYRSLMRLRDLFDDTESLNRQLLAIGELAASSRLNAPGTPGWSAFEPLQLTDTRPGRVSIGRLFGEAVASNQAYAFRNDLFTTAVPRFPGGDIGEYIRPYLDQNLADRVGRNQALMEAIDAMRRMGGTNYRGAMLSLGRELESPTALRQIASLDIPDIEYEDMVREALEYTRPVTTASADMIPPGALRLARRDAADQLGQEVLRRINTMKRFTLEELGRLASVPGFRKGLAGAAIFAGLGLVHEMRGERPAEDMEGPSPLLPGGSPYEDYESDFSPQSIFSAVQQGNMLNYPGYTYSVRANGNFDAHALSSEMQSLTGARTSSTIYQTRQAIAPSHSSSIDLLNSVLE